MYMVTANKLVQFLTDLEYGWVVVEPKGTTIWDLITEYQISLVSMIDGKAGCVDEEKQRTAD